MLNLHSIKEIKSLARQRVLLRLDLDVPVGANGQVDETEDRRLRVSLPTIKYLLRRKAEIVVLGHRSRPGGRRDARLTLRPAVERLRVLLGSRTKVAEEKFKLFSVYTFRVSDQTISVLENLRFDPGERHNDSRLAKQLASLGNIYINDAFANIHRQHASMNALPKLLPSFAGLNLLKEVETLGRVLKRPRRPLSLVFGGIKGETKLKLVEKFIPRADYVMLGSALATNFYRALGFNTGRSRVEDELTTIVRRIIRNPDYSILHNEASDMLLNPDIVDELGTKAIKQLRRRVLLPVDLQVARAAKSQTVTKPQTVLVERHQKKLCPADSAILDIGPRTARLYQEIIERSGTVVWNGPMGLYEQAPYDLGTKVVAEAVASSRAKAIVGGGDTEAAIEAEHIKLKRNVFVSSGGGSMLEFLLNPKLPGLIPLIK